MHDGPSNLCVEEGERLLIYHTCMCKCAHSHHPCLSLCITQPMHLPRQTHWSIAHPFVSLSQHTTHTNTPTTLAMQHCSQPAQPERSGVRSQQAAVCLVSQRLVAVRGAVAAVVSLRWCVVVCLHRSLDACMPCVCFWCCVLQLLQMCWVRGEGGMCGWQGQGRARAFSLLSW